MGPWCDCCSDHHLGQAATLNPTSLSSKQKALTTPASQGCSALVPGKPAGHPGTGIPTLGRKTALESLHLCLGLWEGPWLGQEAGQQTAEFQEIICKLDL